MQNNKENSAIPNELLTFAFQEKQIRVVIVENQHIWLVASDVAEALAYQDASNVLASLDSKNIRKNQSIFDAQGKQITTTLIDVMGCGVLVGSAEPAVAPAFHVWVYDVLIKGSIHDLRARANQVAKPSAKQEIDFQNFVFGENATVRVFLDENGNTWFVASDVCKILELGNVGQALTRLDDDEKTYIISNDVSMGTPKLTIINESGVYSLVLGSKKPEAKAFKKWVTKEVLPTIRKTGEYKLPTAGKDNSTNSPTELSPALMDLLMQKFMEMMCLEQENTQQAISSMRKDIDELKTAFQNFLSPVPTKPGYVYLAYNYTTGLYKPGKGDIPDGRAFALELGGVEIDIVSKIWFPSSSIALMWEKVFHKMFEKEARGREWFALNEKQVQFFKNMAEVVTILYA